MATCIWWVDGLSTDLQVGASHTTKKKTGATTYQGNCEKLCHNTKILYRDTKQLSKKKLNHDKEFAVATYYSRFTLQGIQEFLRHKKSFVMT